MRFEHWNETKSVPTGGFLRSAFGSLSRAQWIVLCLIVVLYLASRLFFLDAYGLFNDEAIHGHRAQLMRATPSAWLHSLSGGKFPLFIAMLALAQAIVPDPLIAGRSIAVGFGLIALLGLFAWSRLLFDRRTALLAGGLYLIFPLTVVHDRMALFDTPANAFTLWGAALILWIFRDGRLGRLGGAAFLAVCAGAILMKWTGIQPALFAPIACVLYGRHRRGSGHLTLVVMVLLLAASLFFVFVQLARLGGFDAGALFDIFRLTGKSREDLPDSNWLLDLREFASYGKFYVGLLPGILAVAGFCRLFRLGQGKDALFCILWLLLPIAFTIFFVRVFYSRYFLIAFVPMLALSARGFLSTLDWASHGWEGEARERPRRAIAAAFLFLVSFSLFLRFSFFSLFAPAETPFYKEDEWQYVSGWPAGTYFSDLADLMGKTLAGRRCNIILRRYSGVVPDGLALYFPPGEARSYSFVPSWSEETIRSRAVPGRLNLVIVDEFGCRPDALEIVASEIEGLRLIREFANPGVDMSKCWVYAYTPRLK